MFIWSKEVIFDASEDFTNFSEIGDYKKIILKAIPTELYLIFQILMKKIEE